MIRNLIVFSLLCLFANSAFAWYRINGVYHSGHKPHSHHRAKPSRPSKSHGARHKSNSNDSEEKVEAPVESDGADSQEKGDASGVKSTTPSESLQTEVIRTDATVGVACQYEKTVGEKDQGSDENKAEQLFLTIFKGTEVLNGCPIELSQTIPTNSLSEVADLSAAASKDQKPVVTGTFNLIVRADTSACHYVRTKSNSESAPQLGVTNETQNIEVIRCTKN